MTTIKVCGVLRSLHPSLWVSMTRTSAIMARMMCDVKNEKALRSVLNLAKPGKRRDVTGSSKPHDSNAELKSEGGIDVEMVTAVDSVARSVKDKGQEVKSDLLKKLREHAECNEELKKFNTTNVSVLFAGMKLENSNKTEKMHSARFNDSNGLAFSYAARRRGAQTPEKPISGLSRNTFPNQKQDTITYLDRHLFEDPAVGIFKKKGIIATSVVSGPSTLFNVLEKEEIRILSSVATMNAFEEMIEWTKEGKLWTFPIDNDQGLTEEAEVGFHEHIFLEPLLNKFPRKGPVRHFMELIAVGLSRNPYLSVQEKKCHINWFEEYFKDKSRYFEDTYTVEFYSTVNKNISS